MRDDSNQQQYPRNGALHKPATGEVSAYLPPTSESDFGMRREDFNLKVATRDLMGAY